MSSALPSTFKGYRQVLFGLASDLQRVEEIAAEWGRPDLREQAASLRARVEERRFTVAVLGEFKRGKSTFINALLGAEVLPADILPTTAAINRVVYGLSPSARLVFRDGRPDQPIEVEELSDAVTKLSEASAALAATLSEAVVQWPVRFCRNDVELLDTPGLADEAAMTEVTLRVLPQVDVALFVVMADSPFSASEAAFLERIRSAAPGEAAPCEVVFVVTAIDRIRRARDRERVLENIRSRIAEVLPEPRVFGLSGQDALDARLEDDPELLAKSGLPEFEEWLEAFLTRSDALGLRRRLDQTVAICQELAGAADKQRAHLEQRRMALSGGRSAHEALLDAISQALERGREKVAQEAAQAGVGKHYEEQLRSLVAQQIDTHLEREEPEIHDLAQGGGYPQAAERVARELWLELVQPVCSVITPYGLGLSEELAPALQRLEHLGIACDEVLAHLAAQGGDKPRGKLAGLIEVQLELLRPPPDAETLRVGKVATALLPRREDLARALMDPSLRAPLEAEQKKDFFGQFSSLLTNPAKDWRQAARAALLEVFESHWHRASAEHVLRSWARELVSVAAKPLAQGQDMCRRARVGLETREQRQDAHIERDQADLSRRLEALNAIARRARQLGQADELS